MSKISNYISESVEELVNRVSWPTWKELQSSSVIVLVSSVIISLLIFLMDISFSNIMKIIYSL